MGYARKDVEKTKKLAKKFVRYQEGAELYSIGLTKFQELAKEAKAVYKIDKVALVNCEIFEESERLAGKDGYKHPVQVVYNQKTMTYGSLFLPCLI